MESRGRDTTGRPLDPEARAKEQADKDSPSPEEDFGGEVVNPEEGETAGSAVDSVDFSGAVSDGKADVKTVASESRIHEVLEEIDRDLVGLVPVKTRVREIAALLVIDRLRQEMDLRSERPTMHMSFTGSPGTGKTTVALRMAAILHRLGYIDKGHLVAVTRDDLVGQYVGHTAPKTKDVVKRAMGGVLFIDEAYYLHRPENERDYGPEAIEVLLQVMESERHNLVVVMAGYEEPMEEFFRANPGMGSRVPHHIDFPDYDVDELMQIAALMVERQTYEMSDAGKAALREYVERRMALPRFANGRSIRNAIDRARLRQASRLFEKGGTLTREELITLEDEDIYGSSVFDQEPEDSEEGENEASEREPVAAE